MIRRLNKRLLRERLGLFPAVALVGSRQCGKTTLVRQLPGQYFDLESPGDGARLDAEWDALVAGKRLLVLDEAQHAAWVFARLRGAIDADRKRNGRFLILGSVSPALMQDVAESLAGRVRAVASWCVASRARSRPRTCSSRACPSGHASSREIRGYGQARSRRGVGLSLLPLP